MLKKESRSQEAKTGRQYPEYSRTFTSILYPLSGGEDDQTNQTN